MSFSTYSGLQEAVADWANRSDQNSSLPTMIALAEARINRDLRVMDMITTVTSSPTSGVVALPDDYLEVYTATMMTSPVSALKFLTVDSVDIHYPTAVSGFPIHYTIDGGNIRLFPTPADSLSFRLRYFAAIPALSDDNTTNWLLTKAPDIYLHATLIEFAIKINSNTLLNKHAELYTAARQKLEGGDLRARIPASGAVVTLAGQTP